MRRYREAWRLGANVSDQISPTCADYNFLMLIVRCMECLGWDGSLCGDRQLDLNRFSFGERARNSGQGTA